MLTLDLSIPKITLIFYNILIKLISKDLSLLCKLYLLLIIINTVKYRLQYFLLLHNNSIKIKIKILTIIFY